ncbi:MAG: tRNA 2-thiouridine(34) synthase MnmA [Alphaproteobacteria bacterium]|nr:tRNA 2-thiouridine(34) synthase MnmA [Alphaproteobacteria bacterium]MCL2505612.1 tRNA 2-thiouridine(34) synthase MnmA [Alphaproteobacteria bacterium]
MKIGIALSGGVDSAAAAALMKEQGHEVIGISLDMGYGNLDDAGRVADCLKIEHQVFDEKAAFQKEVIDYFVKEYMSGRTPSPCCVCNRKIKFEKMKEYAKRLGLEALATGHYAIKKEGGLYKGKNRKKDQSYFLYGLTKEQIAFARFPLGETEDKKQTREIAERYGIPISDKEDSQDICFLGEYKDYREFLVSQGVTKTSGDITDKEGNILGRHKGIIEFTVGQRRGLGISDKKPLFVTKIEGNKIIVGEREDLGKKIIKIENVNWIAEDIESEELDVEVKMRSTQEPVRAVYRKDIGEVELADINYGVAAGQSCVMYREERLLGGGVIQSVEC